MVNPLIVALDVPDLASARVLGEQLSDVVGGFKVGLELLMGHGPTAIESIAALGSPVFADAKLHDIPNTVEKASRQIADSGARWLTIHASGGADMIAAANRGMGGQGVLAVTVLTSLDSKALRSVGVDHPVSDQVAMLAGIAAAGRVEGVVCSPQEAKVVKGLAEELQVFTPGVRPAAASVDDQKRIATPVGALRAGADWLVVGRPITKAPNPEQAAIGILQEIRQELSG